MDLTHCASAFEMHVSEHLPNRLETVPLDGPVQCSGSISRPVVEQGTSVDQGNQQFVGLLRPGGNRQRGFARFLTVEVRVQPFGTHLGNLFHVTPVDALQKAPQIGPGMEGLQLSLVQIQHLVHPALVLELEESGRKKSSLKLAIELITAVGLESARINKP